MMSKLGQCAEKKWRRLRGFDYLTKMMIGINFKDGVEGTKLDMAAAGVRCKMPLLTISRSFG